MLIKLLYHKATPKIHWQRYQPLPRPAGVSQHVGCRQMAALCRGAGPCIRAFQPFEDSLTQRVKCWRDKQPLSTPGPLRAKPGALWWAQTYRGRAGTPQLGTAQLRGSGTLLMLWGSSPRLCLLHRLQRNPEGAGEIKAGPSWGQSRGAPLRQADPSLSPKH